jgi:hypothetical protein
LNALATIGALIGSITVMSASRFAPIPFQRGSL